MAVNWDSEGTQPWAWVPRGYPSAHPLMLKAVAGVALNTFWQTESGIEDTEAREFRVERTGLRLEDETIRPDEMKLITALRPIIYGTLGEVLRFYIGGQNGQAESAIFWEGPYTFEIGVDTKIDCVVSCRYAAYRIETDSLIPFVLTALEFEFEGIGTD